MKLFLIPGVGGPSFLRVEVSDVKVAARGSILEDQTGSGASAKIIIAPEGSMYLKLQPCHGNILI